MSRHRCPVTGSTVDLEWLLDVLEEDGFTVDQISPTMLNVSGGGVRVKFYVSLDLDARVILVGHSWRIRQEESISVVLGTLNDANSNATLNSFVLREDGDLVVSAKLHVTDRELSPADFQRFVRGAHQEFVSVMLHTNLFRLLA